MAVPDRVFDTDMTITLGGDTVRLHRVAPSHSNSMIMITFPKYKALQCTDACVTHSMPFNDLPDFYYDGFVKTLDWVLQQDVDIIDDGHNQLGTKADQKKLRDYLVDLHDQILDLLRKGQSWDQLYRNVRFSDEVRSWNNFNQNRILNTLGMYRWVSEHRRGEW